MTETARAFTAGFRAVSPDDWRILAQRSLAGASFDEKLVARTITGQRIEPIYERYRGSDVQPVRHARRWSVIQRICPPEPDLANAAALADLEGGADGLELIFAGSVVARGTGIHIDTLDDMDRLLKGIPPETTLRIDGGHHTGHILAMLIALARRRGIAPAALRMHFAADAFSNALVNGALTPPHATLQARLRDAICTLRELNMKPQLFTVGGHTVHDAGASEELELAYVAANLVYHMRLLETCGIAPDHAHEWLGICLAADADQFMTIAKFRAARRIWANIQASCGLPPQPLHVHAKTAWRMMTRYDPHVNILRTAMASFAAGVGGADSITALPHTMACGRPDAASSRIARNMQLILLEESNLHHVADPAAGSGAIEALTAMLAEHAWRQFQAIEAEGGLRDCLTAGTLQRQIAQYAARRGALVAARQAQIVGVSAYAKRNEPRPGSVGTQDSFALETTSQAIDLPPPGQGELLKALVDAAESGCKLADMIVARGRAAAVEIATISVIRSADVFEQLRDAALDFAERRGEAPAIAVICLGEPADFQHQLARLVNTFAVGGIVAKVPGALTSPHEAADAFRISKCRIACICGSDAVYEDLAAPTAEALRTTGAWHVLIAATPGSREHEWRAAGVSEFIHDGSDLLETLRELHRMLGVAPAVPSPEPTRENV